uniref:Uncharacterized protein n=1 Tax=Amphilophus citrinellus TaxID=61819 RepID=A0A3Q0T3E9_AMPCI
MIPGPIIHLSHIQQEVQAAIQQLWTYLGVLLAACSIFALLGFAMGKEDEAVGLSRTEIERDRSHPLGVPLRETDVGLWSLKRNWIKGGHILTLVGYLTLDFHLGVHNSSQAGQLKTDVIVLIHYL